MGMAICNSSKSSASINGNTLRGIWSLWKEDVKCVFHRDPAANSVLEVLTTYPGVQAILFHRVSHRLWRKGWRYPARLLSYIARLISNVDIHPGAKIGSRFFIDHGAGVVIGETAEVGNDVTLYHGVTLGGTSWNKGKRHPTLEDGVMVGTGAKILGPIEVGKNARVGANSVVVEAVPMECTVVGIPGRVVKTKKHAANTVHGIDLDHHLIPDPVGKAIACLLDRIDKLEIQVEKYRVCSGEKETTGFECEPDSDICANDCRIGATLINGS